MLASVFCFASLPYMCSFISTSRSPHEGRPVQMWAGSVGPSPSSPGIHGRWDGYGWRKQQYVTISENRVARSHNGLEVDTYVGRQGLTLDEQ